ncbi:hypothetical protein JCM10450v2_006214 [Rhodotorula kratochvilovae]
MSLLRLTTLVTLAAASLAPVLASPSSARLHARQTDSSDDSVMDDAWTVLKDLGSAAFSCPSDCGSYLIAAARCSLQIVQDLSVSQGLECFCTEIPSDLDKCSACVAEEDSTNSFVGGTTGAADLVNKACSFFGIATSSGLSSGSSSASSASSASGSMVATTFVTGDQTIVAWVPNRVESSSSSSVGQAAHLTLAASSTGGAVSTVTVTATPTGAVAAAFAGASKEGDSSGAAAGVAARWAAIVLAAAAGAVAVAW